MFDSGRTMPHSHPVIPAAPVVVPLAIVSFVLAIRRLRRRGAATAPRIVVTAMAAVYVAGLLKSVLLPFPVRVGHARDGMVGWRLHIQLVPLVTADPIGVVLNVAL